MGIRALELTGAERGHLVVKSLAGLRPPFSCLNDGLQVSTGATLGQGMITVIESATPKFAAVFTAHSNIISLKIREDYLEQVNKVIGFGLKNFELISMDYWNYVRKHAIRYWLDWDRKEIFEITK